VSRFLAVAHQTAETSEFLTAVREAAGRETDAEVVLLVPATPVNHLAAWTQGEALAIAGERAESARRRLEETGVNVVEAKVGDADPYQAILDALADDNFDHIIVSTFPPGISRWLSADLIHRVRRSMTVPITHVVSR
jgi:nucleotide-binding universal stress UspA family protein